MTEEEKLYGIVLEHATQHNFVTTLKALETVRNAMANPEGAPAARRTSYYSHCLAVTHMLIGLNIPLTPQEMDIALSAALCHVLPELYDRETWLTSLARLFPERGSVAEIVAMITREESQVEINQQQFYDRIRQNKLALLVRLADRGNLVESLYDVPVHTAYRYIQETRHYFFPLCIHAKERYPELLGHISVLMEKMRNLIDVSEILLNRYSTEEMELTKEILELEDENARIRSIIRVLNRH